jgi:xanthine dehydrogenase large subunit
VREALRQAVGEFGPSGRPVTLGSPATPEVVFWAVKQAADAALTESEQPHVAERVTVLAAR